MLGESSEQTGSGPLAVGPGPVDADALAHVIQLLPRRADRGLVVALIPARNEERNIQGAVLTLREQDVQPDLIVVCADNCNDGTILKAEAAGAEVFETVANEHGRSGALNQALGVLLPELQGKDAVVVMNADVVLARTFLGEACRHMNNGAGGLSGVFTARSSGGFGLFRPDDYALYARDFTRVYGEILVASGAATLFSVAALRHIAWARASGALPGGLEQVYDTKVLRTDSQLTVALLYLGYQVFARLAATHGRPTSPQAEAPESY